MKTDYDFKFPMKIFLPEKRQGNCFKIKQTIMVTANENNRIQSE